MHSLIFHSSTLKSRKKTVNKYIESLWNSKLPTSLLEAASEPDLLLINSTTSIGISDIRDLKNSLSPKPYSRNTKVAVILSAQLLTTEAQHALLKTLEEPTPSTHIILEINNPNLLLPTILSRCQLVTVKSKEDYRDNHSKSSTTTTEFLKKNSTLRLQEMKAFSTKDQALDFLNSITKDLEVLLKHDPGLTPSLKNVLRARLAIKSNVNPKLVLEHLALTLHNLIHS